ncbi:hypothetical protein glysoja_009331 [Glycine soja]|nr:hypothetical protein glysoja_009331 [Glycine soja]
MFMFPICILKWIDKFTKHLIIPKIVIMNSQDPDSQFPCIPISCSERIGTVGKRLYSSYFISVNGI